MPSNCPIIRRFGIGIAIEIATVLPLDPRGSKLSLPHPERDALSTFCSGLFLKIP
jgi:hypothetical protein